MELTRKEKKVIQPQPPKYIFRREANTNKTSILKKKKNIHLKVFNSISSFTQLDLASN